MMDPAAGAQENDDDDLRSTNDHIFSVTKRMILRTRNHLSPNSKPTNVEEQIIQKRGRRVFTKPTPCTPPPSRKRRADDSSVDQPQPQESPFTKCLRGLLSPKRGVDPPSGPSASSSSSQLLSSSDLPSKKFYYSPNPPYQLRSMDVSIRSSTGNSSIRAELNDSGIGLSPETSLSNTTNTSDCSAITDSSISSSTSSSKTTNVKKSDSKLSTKTSTTARRINGVRRRFRF